MNELSPEAKELLAMASGVDDPSVDDKARVKRAILAAAAVGVVSGASVAAAGTSVGAGSAGGVGAAAGSVAAGGSAAAGSAATVAAGASSLFAAKVAVVLALVGAGAGAVVVSEPWGPSRAPVATVEREARAVDDDGFVDSRSATAARREAVDTELVDTELVDAVPVDTESVDTESVDTEPVDTEPVDTESVDTESVDTARVELVDEPRRPSGLRSRVSPRVETGDGESGDESGDTLAAELSLLRRARSAHAVGDHTAALAALAEHEAAFPRGVLRAERDGTRALVACAAAPRAETAAEFLRAHPTSPLAARVRAACEVE